MSQSQWLLWQLADSAFPAGGFAHSGGLEAACQAGRVTNGAALDDYLQSQLTQAARGLALFVSAARREPQRQREWDHACDLFLNNHVANRASRAQGQAFLLTASRTFEEPRVKELWKRRREDDACGHFAPLLGSVGAALDIEITHCARLFLFLNLRGLVSAAVRLGIIGPMQGQSAQWRLAARAESLAQAVNDEGIDRAASTAPLLDLLQGTQDRLYSRLFQS